MTDPELLHLLRRVSPASLRDHARVHGVAGPWRPATQAEVDKLAGGTVAAVVRPWVLRPPGSRPLGSRPMAAVCAQNAAGEWDYTVCQDSDGSWPTCEEVQRKADARSSYLVLDPEPEVAEPKAADPKALAAVFGALAAGPSRPLVPRAQAVYECATLKVGVQQEPVKVFTDRVYFGMSPRGRKGLIVDAEAILHAAQVLAGKSPRFLTALREIVAAGAGG